MRLRGGAVLACLLALAAGALRADLRGAKAEANLEKRSKLALDNAERVLKDAREAYNKGEMKQSETAVAEFRESVELAMSSLRDTGKNPRKSPKWFKRAEIQTRDLMRKIDAFDQEMSVSDRPMLADAKKALQEVHEELLLGVMEGKK